MSNAFDRLKNKNRPKVPKRTDPLNDINNNQSQSKNTSIKENQEAASAKATTTENNAIQNDSKQLASITNDINNKLLDFKTISASWRIHPEVKEAIDSLIKEKNATESIKITKDTFVEAAIVICQQNPQILDSVLEEAKTRQEFRNKAGAYKRSQSILQKLNDQ